MSGREEAPIAALAVVAAIIENSDGRILLVQRPPGKYLAGLWEFPGGKVEMGESAETALHRELKEELGLEVEIQSSLGVFHHIYDWGPIALNVFVVHANNAPQISDQVHVFRWCLPHEVRVQDLTPADHRPLARYLSTCLNSL
ncbi:MAG: (deoxy)nucleoside triphosphate pyrophosphohydrolase [Bdellovibrionales bacterium]